MCYFFLVLLFASYVTRRSVTWTKCLRPIYEKQLYGWRSARSTLKLQVPESLAVLLLQRTLAARELAEQIGSVFTSRCSQQRSGEADISNTQKKTSLGFSYGWPYLNHSPGEEGMTDEHPYGFFFPAPLTSFFIGRWINLASLCRLDVS